MKDEMQVLVGVLKQKLEYFQEMKKISDMEAKAINFEWDSGYAVGQKVAYEDAVDELQELIKSITGVPTEPKS